MLKDAVHQTYNHNEVNLSETTFTRLEGIGLSQLNNELSLSSIGGGFCGTLTALHWIKNHEELTSLLGEKTPHLTINLYDKDGAFGQGLAYKQVNDADSSVLILTQPPGHMSPFSAAPDLYTDWLKENAPQYTEVDFTPRELYGRFLSSLLEEAQERIEQKQLPITLRRIKAEVVGVTPEGDSYLLEGREGTIDPAQGIVIASGHQTKDELSKFNGLSAYICGQSNPERLIYTGRSQEDEGTILLIGGGPSAIDAIRAFEHHGFEGKYKVITSSPVAPWAFIQPIEDAPNLQKFSPKFLVPDELSPTASDLTLRKLLHQEVKHAERQGFGPGYVYYGLPLESILERKASGIEGKGYEEFAKYVIQLRGAATCPENCEIYNKLRQNHRIKLISARADAEKSYWNEDSQQFELSVQRKNGSTHFINGDMLVNCATIRRSVKEGEQNKELLQSLSDTGLVSLTKAGLLSSQSPNVAVVGPPAEPKNSSHGFGRLGYGVESFRDEVEHSATRVYHNAVEKVLGKSLVTT